MCRWVWPQENESQVINEERRRLERLSEAFYEYRVSTKRRLSRAWEDCSSTGLYKTYPLERNYCLASNAHIRIGSLA